MFLQNRILFPIIILLSCFFKHKMKTQIVLFDDYPLFREGIKLILENSGNYNVIGEASDEVKLFEILEKEQPEFILINLMASQDEIRLHYKTIKNKFF